MLFSKVKTERQLAPQQERMGLGEHAGEGRDG